jgi:hypothetical protein
MDDCITCTTPDRFSTKSWVVGILGFGLGLVTAWRLPPIGLWAAYYLGYPVILLADRLAPIPEGEDDMRGWWIVIAGFVLQELFYALLGLWLARKIFIGKSRPASAYEQTSFDEMQEV